jgi:copper chaperone CopZ
MIVIVMVAIPMYVCATGSIPIALSLMLKGITLGTALVFLMAGPAVNFASYTLLSRSLGKRNTLLYIAIIALSAITTGLIIDYLLPRAWFVHKLDYARDCCMQSTSILNTVSSVILVALLVYALIVKRFKSTNKQNVMAKQYRINGMMCVHCKARVEKELATLPGVSSVKVDLEKKLAYVEGNPSDTNIADKVNALGYEYVGIK